MKKAAIAMMLIIASYGAASAQAQSKSVQAKPQRFTNFIDSASYAYGLIIGKNLESLKVGFNYSLVNQAMSDVKNNANIYSDSLITKIMSRLQQVVQLKEKQRIETLSKENAVKSSAFFVENAKRPTVKTTQTGLQYETVSLGPTDGRTPSVNDTAVVNYEARFVDGKLFESSFENGKPIRIPINAIIQGLREALLMMKPQDTYVFYIPSNLAYGEKGAPSIEPNQGLIFKINLLEIVKGSAPIEKF